MKKLKDLYFEHAENVFLFIGAVVFVILFAIGIIALQSWIVMFLWNLVATYFGLKLLTFKAAIAVTALLAVVGGFFSRKK